MPSKHCLRANPESAETEGLGAFPSEKGNAIGTSGTFLRIEEKSNKVTEGDGKGAE